MKEIRRAVTIVQVGTNADWDNWVKPIASMGKPGFLANLPIHGGMLKHHEGMEIFLPILVTKKLPEDIFSFDGEKSLIQSLGHNLTDLNGLSH
jgi:hypothetical protein